jgi:hypothetical protein
MRSAKSHRALDLRARFHDPAVTAPSGFSPEIS